MWFFVDFSSERRVWQEAQMNEMVSALPPRVTPALAWVPGKQSPRQRLLRKDLIRKCDPWGQVPGQ